MPCRGTFAHLVRLAEREALCEELLARRVAAASSGVCLEGASMGNLAGRRNRQAWHDWEEGERCQAPLLGLGQGAVDAPEPGLLRNLIFEELFVARRAPWYSSSEGERRRVGIADAPSSKEATRTRTRRTQKRWKKDAVERVRRQSGQPAPVMTRDQGGVYRLATPQRHPRRKNGVAKQWRRKLCRCHRRSAVGVTKGRGRTTEKGLETQ